MDSGVKDVEGRGNPVSTPSTGLLLASRSLHCFLFTLPTPEPAAVVWIRVPYEATRYKLVPQSGAFGGAVVLSRWGLTGGVGLTGPSISGNPSARGGMESPVSSSLHFLPPGGEPTCWATPSHCDMLLKALGPFDHGLEPSHDPN